MARNQYFAKGEGLEPQVKKFYNYIKIGIRDKQTSVTQIYHIRGSKGGDPATGVYGGMGAKTQAAGQFFDK